MSDHEQRVKKLTHKLFSTVDGQMWLDEMELRYRVKFKTDTHEMYFDFGKKSVIERIRRTCKEVESNA